MLLDGFDELAVTVDPGDGSLLAWCLLAALSSEQRARGLMEVTDLQGYSGMAFVYDEDVQNAFHMRNTPTPLSIAWIAADGSVVSIADMEPCEDRDGCPTYPPSGPYRYAIEVFQGDLAELGITESSNVRVGDLSAALGAAGCATCTVAPPWRLRSRIACHTRSVGSAWHGCVQAARPPLPSLGQSNTLPPPWGPRLGRVQREDVCPCGPMSSW